METDRNRGQTWRQTENDAYQGIKIKRHGGDFDKAYLLQGGQTQ